MFGQAVLVQHGEPAQVESTFKRFWIPQEDRADLARPEQSRKRHSGHASALMAASHDAPWLVVNVVESVAMRNAGTVPGRTHTRHEDGAEELLVRQYEEECPLLADKTDLPTKMCSSCEVSVVDEECNFTASMSAPEVVRCIRVAIRVFERCRWLLNLSKNKTRLVGKKASEAASMMKKGRWLKLIGANRSE